MPDRRPTIRPTAIDGVRLIEPVVFGDDRGRFFEAWRDDRYRAGGLDVPFVQDNVSTSVRGVLRGLHVQEPYGQAKLVQVLVGEVFDVAVDVRVGSPTFGRWVGERLSGDNHRQLFVPAGLAHGFCTLSDVVVLTYKCSEYYHPEAEFSVAWDDPDLAIPWPIDDPILSEKDATAMRLVDVPVDRLPRWTGAAR